MPGLMATTTSECLQSLPPEIIQNIHVQALEPNLPRAWPRFGAAISQQFFYDIFLLHAFWVDPHGVPARGQGPHSCGLPDWYHPLSEHERRRLQAQLMTCRWFSARCMQEAIRMFSAWTWRALMCRS